VVATISVVAAVGVETAVEQREVLMQIFNVGPKCLRRGCECHRLSGKAYEDDSDPTPPPPLHDECDCFLVDDITRRLGKFEIIEEMIERWPDEVLRIMSRCIVTRAEFLFHKHTFEYIAYSRDFEESNEPYGAPILIPTYVWEFDSEKEKLRAIRVSGDRVPSASRREAMEIFKGG